MVWSTLVDREVPMDDIKTAVETLLRNADLLPAPLESELWLFKARLNQAEIDELRQEGQL